MQCQIMGIVNVTPDSFSDGGRYFTPEEAVRRAVNHLAEGADIIDFGAESTRPGSTPLAWRDEWARLEPVLALLPAALAAARRPAGSVRLSVDTYHPETAERALAAGVTILNCVYRETAGEMIRLARQAGPHVEAVVPYRPEDPPPPDGGAGLYLDPMIGFGTTREEDLALLRALPELAHRGRVLIGASRKRIVKKLTGEKTTGKNLGGNLGIAVWCALNGASVVRVHDVLETRQAVNTALILAGRQSLPEN